MSTTAWLWVCGIVGGILVIWVGVAAFGYFNDANARAYAASQQPAATTTTTGTTTASTSNVVVVQQPVQNDSGLGLFFWGYMLGGFGNYGGYGSYRSTVNNYYTSSPQYQSGETYDSSSGSWGTDEDTGGSVTPSDDSSGDSTSFGSDNSSGDSTSFGSDDSSGDSGSSYSAPSDDSGSWGSDDSGGSYGGGDDGGGSFGGDDE